jgi:hypothetical protein
MNLKRFDLEFSGRSITLRIAEEQPPVVRRALSGSAGFIVHAAVISLAAASAA